MFSAENEKLAVQDVLGKRLSLRQAAYLKKSSVGNFVKKISEECFENCKFGLQYTTRQVLSTDMEELLEKSPQKLAYEFAVEINYHILRHGRNKAWLAMTGIRDS
ncbi:hypothetical protein JTB14_005298 [Gonioctena quinquepunctata]|nr:hypothetical protein JTB14_005298 [Gonioctena quinquepunctata]